MIYLESEDSEFFDGDYDIDDIEIDLFDPDYTFIEAIDGYSVYQFRYLVPFYRAKQPGDSEEYFIVFNPQCRSVFASINLINCKNFIRTKNRIGSLRLRPIFYRKQPECLSISTANSLSRS
jgi:hypothetical protein